VASLWGVHNDYVVKIEPRVGLEFGPEHSYVITKLCLGDVVVESPQ